MKYTIQEIIDLLNTYNKSLTVEEMEHIVFALEDLERLNNAEGR